MIPKEHGDNLFYVFLFWNDVKRMCTLFNFTSNCFEKVLYIYNDTEMFIYFVRYTAALANTSTCTHNAKIC